MILQAPRLVVSGLSGDAGKTLLTIGLARAWRDRGIGVAPFKKGPDYIDAAWMGEATGRPGRNLDTFLMSAAAIGTSVCRVAPSDIVLVEGNRGLHDGVDALGTHSTAELAKLLGAPVVIVVDATKATRTLAACVRGCAVIDPDLRIGAVVLNRVANARHARTIAAAFDALGGPAVVGVLPRFSADPLPSRHLGLVTTAEHGGPDRAVAAAAQAVVDHVDTDALLELARTVAPVTFPDADDQEPARPGHVRIGVLRDEAFMFYYPENIEALIAAGAEVVEVSPLRASALPPVDVLYIGGGFPETHASALARNTPFLASVRAAASSAVPIYAECGGLMYLSRELRVDGQAYPMAGVLDVSVEQTGRPQGHGYVEAQVDRSNPFFPIGTYLRGHEFHYSRLVEPVAVPSALRLDRGTGIGGGRDAFVVGSTWASYVHLHASGTPAWATGLVGAAGRAGAPRWA
ncbi:MAG: cobyrinate a,c-diamide synthase [Vicinamibacterales bacterium]|nr:cobyrinate a,c-diamide synthase [Vicinamibacterales bacterium]